MQQKIILTDVDGVICNWEWAFEVWMEEHGHKLRPQHAKSYDIHLRYGLDKEDGRKLIKLFNESAAIGFLPALRDATYYIKLLHEKHGYVFDVITSLSTNPYAQKLRKRNLRKLFGETAFRKFKFLPTGGGKESALAPYKDSGLWWIEDKIENAELGAELGLRTMLMAHGHNFTYQHPDILVVKDWAEIYKIIIDMDGA
jgi:hypothetical protein